MQSLNIRPAHNKFLANILGIGMYSCNMSYSFCSLDGVAVLSSFVFKQPFLSQDRQSGGGGRGSPSSRFMKKLKQNLLLQKAMDNHQLPNGCLSLFNYFIDMKPEYMSLFLVEKTSFCREKTIFFLTKNGLINQGLMSMK